MAYVGQHRFFPFTTRYLGSGIYLRKAIKKHGKESFDVQLLQYCETQKELDLEEIYYINTYRRLWGSELYNISYGGVGQNMTGRKHNKESIIKMSESRKAFAKTDRYKESMIGKTTGKKIRCIETKTVYESITKAAKSGVSSYAGLYRVLSGMRKTTGGYHWEFA